MRLGLGSPQRVMVEHTSNGPFLLHSFIETTGAQHDALQEIPAHVGLHPGGSNQAGQSPEIPDDGGVDEPPMLLTTVVAPTSEAALEARRAGARLERVGQAIQSSWTGCGSD